MSYDKQEMFKLTESLMCSPRGMFLMYDALKACCENSLQVTCGASLIKEHPMSECNGECENCQYNDVDKVMQYFIRKAIENEN